MYNKIFTIAMLTSLFLTSCSNTPTVTTAAESVTTTTVEETVKSSSTDKDGKKLEMSFNNTTNVATVVFNDETFEMTLDSTMASGSNYKNDHYQYTEWHGKTTLTKDGKVVFNAGEEVMPK